MADSSPAHSRGALVAVLLAALVWGCSSGDSTDSDTASNTSSTASTPGAPAEPVEVTESSFVNLNDMTAVRGFFVDNLVGDLEATLDVAESEDGGVYPVGSVVQLVPGEAMVKQPEGFSPGTRDWEFFELDVDASGTTIRVRGGVEAVNRFGGSCADCHAQADPRFDFICEQDHGCDPLPIGRPIIEGLQASDPRPRT